jgi:hypothetical protein
MEKTKKKFDRCPNGTNRNKKTGICVAKSLLQCTRKNNCKIKQNWDEVVTKTTETYNGKIYECIVIPKNTYVYRGFQYGEEGLDNDLKRGTITKEEYDESIEDEKIEYKRNVKGLYFGNLGVACYYAFDPDISRKRNHSVSEYITVKSVLILDMSVWQNIKNIMDDVKDKDANSIFKATYGFDTNNPEKTLFRDSGGVDDVMIELMLKWLKKKTTPKINGFGHSKMTGFHSEFACVKQTGFVKRVNEYNQSNRRVTELVNVKKPTDKILLHTVSFDNGEGKHINIGEQMF